MGSGDPPELKDGANYSQYRRDILIWQLSTTLDKSKQAGRAILKMSGKVREHCSRFSLDELKRENGLEFLLTELDKYFKKDSTQELFLAIEKLEKYRRNTDKETIVQYIEVFTRLNDRVAELTTSNTTYDDGILAYRLLNQASLSEQDTKFVRATVQKLSFEEMVTALKKCLGDGVLMSRSEVSGTVQIKQEPQDSLFVDAGWGDESKENSTFYTGNRGRGSRGNFRSRGFRNQSRNSPYKNSGGYYGRGGRGNQSRGSGYDGQSRGGSYGNQGRGGHQSANRGKDQFKSSRDVGSAAGNSLDEFGVQRRCRVCDSRFHFKNDCPHRFEAPTLLQSVFAEEKVILNIDEDYNTFQCGDETVNRALIDTGATVTVCGSRWMESYLSSLTDEDRKLVSSEDRGMVFRFGDGRGVKSVAFTIIPIRLCGKHLRLGTYVVEGDLPLFFSRLSLKEFGICLDIKDDKISIGNISQDLIVTSSGHYVAELQDKATILLCKDSDAKKMAEKLHRYYGHPSEKRLCDLVKSTEFCSKELLKEIKEVSQKCEHCLVYQRNRSRPKASLLTARDVNDIVGMDLKQLSTGHLMMHCIDLFSRFSMTSIIPDKSKDTIIKVFFLIWVSIFGRANLVITDNGGEFVNKE